MSVSDVLDGVFKLLRANFRTIAVIIGCLVIPFQIVAAVLQRDVLGGRGIFTVIHDPSAVQGQSGNFTTSIVQLVISLINLLLLPFVAGAIARVVSASYLGRQIGPAEAFRGLGRKAPALLVAWFAIHIPEVIGFALCVFPGVCIMTLFVMTAPIIVIEDLGPFRGMRRAAHLAARRFWPVMGITVLAGLMAQVMSSVLAGVPLLVGLVIGLRWGFLLIAAGGALTALVVTPIASITATLLYFDGRIRSEGFDLEVLAAGLARDAA